MTQVFHLCQGGTAAERVADLFGGRVIAIDDDLSIGPLFDVDDQRPEARAAFWAALFAADESMASMDWRAELIDARDALADLARAATEVVIWVGSHPVDQALRRRGHWWLQGAQAVVTEALAQFEDAGPDACSLYTPIAIIPDDNLRACFERRRAATIEERGTLAAEWADLRTNGRGVRLWEAGRLWESPIEHYDAHLLSLVGAKPSEFIRTVGQAMAETGRSDAFCRWRYEILSREGRLSRTLEGPSPYSGMLRRGAGPLV